MAKKKQAVSPVSTALTQAMTFPDAVREILNGKRVTRISWNDQNEFGLLRNGELMIYTRSDYHQWLVNDGDMGATDWVVLPDGNS